MSSLFFQEVFGTSSAPQNECSNTKIDFPYPTLPEVSDLYQKLIDTCADPQSLLDLLNIQIMNHIRSGTPDHFNNFQLSQMLNPFFTILPYILSDRSIIAQTHSVLIKVNHFLSPWQYFSFQSFYSYFDCILSSKIYTGESRQWLISTIFDLLSQNKSVFSNSVVTRVHLKDKQFKDSLHAVVNKDKTISIYSQNTCIKKGILTYEPDENFPIHQIIEMNKDKKVTYKVRIVFLDSSNEKVTSDSFEHFLNDGSQIYQLIWSCVSCKNNEFTFEELDVIVRTILGYNGTFLQIFYYSQLNESLFKSLMSAAIFIHRHTFVLKTLIWAIFDEATDKNKLFKSPFPGVKYIITFVRDVTKKKMSFLMEQMIEYIDLFELDENNFDLVDFLSDSNFKHGIIKRFWESLLLAAQTFPKTIFDICFQLKTYSDMYLSKDSNRNCYSQAKDLMLSEVIIPSLFNNLRLATDKNRKDCLNFVIKSVTLTTASNKDDEFGLLGVEPLKKFLEFICADSSNLNVKDILMPSIQHFVNAAHDLIDCVKGSTEYLRKCAPKKTSNFTSSSTFNDFSEDEVEHPQIPVLRKKRTSKSASENLATLKDSEQSVNHLEQFKEIPSNQIPWKSRIAKDIFYSYYVSQHEKQ